MQQHFHLYEILCGHFRPQLVHTMGRGNCTVSFFLNWMDMNRNIGTKSKEGNPPTPSYYFSSNKVQMGEALS